MDATRRNEQEEEREEREQAEAKEREATKNANDLKRATEKVSSLEEKVAALKEHFKQKEPEREEDFAKKLNLKEEKLKEVRLKMEDKFSFFEILKFFR